MTATHDNTAQHMRTHITSRLSFAVGLLGVMLTLAIGPSMAQDAYLSAARDIPLAPGLEETGDGSLAFDKPQGRIIRVTARDAQNAFISQDVLAFYRQTLPNLGWLETGDRDTALTFKRESEMLRISIIGDLVIFDVTPF